MFGPIDFEGQKLSERLCHIILVLTGIAALAVGFGTESVYNMWYTMLGGVVITCIICLPAWPFYNRHPLNWQPATAVPSEEKKKK